MNLCYIFSFKMSYAHGLVDKNNVIRTVEDIMCTSNDTSHQTITELKTEINNQLQNYCTEADVQNSIDTTLNNRLQNYCTEDYAQILIDTTIKYELPDKYFDKNQVNYAIECHLDDYHADEIFPNYATKTNVNETKTEILNQIYDSYFTRKYIEENYYTREELSGELFDLDNRLKDLEERIKALESK